MNIIISRLKLTVRYFRLYIKEKLEFPIEGVMSIIDFMVNIFSIIVFWISMKNINVNFIGWSYEMIVLLVGYNFLATGVNSIFFGFRDIEYKIISGEFDTMLSRPVSPFVQIVLSRLNFFYILLNLLVGIVAIIYSAVFFDYNIIHIFSAIWISITSSISLGLLYAMFSLLAFKFGKIYSARELVFSIATARNYPIDIFPKALYNLFIYVIPLGLMSTIPAKVSAGEYLPEKYLLFSTLAMFTFLILYIFLSKRALLKYKSVGN